MERALPSTERGSPDADRTSPTASTLLLLFAETPAEEDLLHAWMVDTGRAHAAHVRAGIKVHILAGQVDQFRYAQASLHGEAEEGVVAAADPG